MQPLSFALLPSSPGETRTRHFVGAPGRDVGEIEVVKEFLPARLLVISRGVDDQIFLYRFDSRGQFAGDTWHRNEREARQQARWEYGDTVLDWRPVPDTVEDLQVFVKQVLGEIPGE